jgi:hypothetical protein
VSKEERAIHTLASELLGDFCGGFGHMIFRPKVMDPAKTQPIQVDTDNINKKTRKPLFHWLAAIIARQIKVE